MTPLQKYATVFGAGLLLAALLAASYGIGRGAGLRYAADNQPPPDTVTVVKTIKEKYPPITGLKPLRTVWVPLPVKSDSVANQLSNPGDSAMVAIPIEQAYYHREEYDAWVSGFQPKLDSIIVYPKTVTITTAKAPPPPSRWNFSITAGPGIVWDGKGVHGGVGIVAGLSYSF